MKIPVRIYAGMPVGQLIYFEISGPVAHSYSKKASAKYRAVSAHPTPSRMHLNFPRPSTGKPSRKGTRRRARSSPAKGRPR